MENILHSSKSEEWMTPPEIVAKVKSVLGIIQIDPASTIKANKLIEAHKIYTKFDDALRQDWWCDKPKTMFINPPGGRYKGKSQANLFWDKLIQHRNHGLVTEAIFLAFSIEFLQTCQVNCATTAADFTFCVPQKRLKFVNPETGIASQSTHASAIIYVDGLKKGARTFVKEFESLGRCFKGV